MCTGRAVGEAIPWVWKKFGKAILEGYQSASKIFWQTLWSRGRAMLYQICLQLELLTLTGNVGGQWKEYFKDLLKPTDVLSVEKAKAVDLEVEPFIT